MEVIKYLEEAVKIEINASKLYFMFADHYKEDFNFWWEIANEELNHAALLKTTIEFAELNDLPEEIILNDIQELINLNLEFDKIIESFKSNPSRQSCFEIALIIESSVGESHYQEIMSGHTDNEVIKIFQHLNREDVNHFERITDYYNIIKTL